MTADPVMVRDPGHLAGLIERWSSCEMLALDTEFERTNTFYAQPALLQIGDGTDQFLLDPTAIADLRDFYALLQDPGITKVLHACREDLELLHHMGSVATQAIFDTQIAAALLGYGYSLGYRALVSKLCGVMLAKDETRSNWLRRPLSSAQIQYAALDVAYLPEIYRRLRDELQALNRLAWLDEETELLLDRIRTDDDFSIAYQRIAAARTLNRRELGRLRALCAWREQQARRRNLPRGFVLRDEVLVSLAGNGPRAIAGPTGLDRLSRGQRKRFAKVLVAIIEKVENVSENQLPHPAAPTSDLRPYTAVLKQMKSAVQATALELNLAPEILANRRSLEELIRHLEIAKRADLTSHFNGWRRPVIGEQLLACLGRC